MESYWKGIVQCPFYKNDDGKSIVRCEGVEGSLNTTLFFRRKKHYQDLISKKCVDNYEDCKVYKMLMTKYEE